MPKAPKNLRDFKSLVNIIEHLRGPEGCPWDLQQTHRSLSRYALEESYELAEAIESHNPQAIKEELGDLLLQVVLHSEIARQSGTFTIEDVIESIADKMIRRHPHVFADVQVSSAAEVTHNWQKIKAQEKAKLPHKTSIFEIPVDMPALMRSQKIGEKTRKFNFDWQKVAEVLLKVDEELQELKDVIAQDNKTEQSSELGDLLFSVAQLGRHLDLDSEQALRETNKRFETRFSKMQELSKKDGKDFSKLSANELEAYWNLAKSKLK